MVALVHCAGYYAFVVHGLLLAINGVSPLKYFRKVWPGDHLRLYQPLQRRLHSAER
ncbi:hypothetical protein LNP74_23480 [Klebsiella pneumoniae subsp. pneumoniae]|nr:hypothetical protein [Klebsiella pneumoniae subsp. pneumoniae]